MELNELLKSTDLNQLKSAAYDQIASNEQGQQILQAINKRIGEIAQQQYEALPGHQVTKQSTNQKS